jgi:DNA replication licensing factor MCM4
MTDLATPGKQSRDETRSVTRGRGLNQETSEIDMSSPLNYGTPSSRLGGLGDIPRTPGVLGTPIRPRSDIGNEHRMTVNVGGSELDGAVAESEGDCGTRGPQLVVWGTDVVVAQCKIQFTRFIERFVNHDVDVDEKFDGMNTEQPFYLQKLEEISITGEPFLNVNCAHLKQFDADLYRQLYCYPQEVIPTFDMAVNEMFFNRFPNAAIEHQIQVRPFNAAKTTSMRSLNPEDIDRLITIAGMVIRTSGILPEMREAFFQCHICRSTLMVEIERGRIAEPTLCRSCQTNHSFQLIHNRSLFSDKQMVKLQEVPEDMPAGQTPQTIVVFAHNDLVDKVQPGDRVTLTGIYRASPMRMNPRVRNVLAVYKTHIDTIHYRKMDAKRLHQAMDEDDGYLLIIFYFLVTL